MNERAEPEMDSSKYHYDSAEAAHTHAYLFPAVLELLDRVPSSARVFELGCGNGSTAHALADLGYDVTAVDTSTEGIRIAREHFPNCRFAVASAYDDLAAQYGGFQAVISLEVIEHVFYPRRFAATVAALLNPDGQAIISTPYHGYLKNLALSVANRWDTHMDPLWDYGHIKLWSRETLTALFEEAGLTEIDFRRVGRVPVFAKSMISSFQKKTLITD